MHVVFRESHGLEETDTPFDLGQDPADLVVLSFSDSDLGAFAAGWHRAAGGLPTVRMANLVALRHPLSVDTYAEQTLSGAKGILIRLIGGESYWPYGLLSAVFVGLLMWLNVANLWHLISSSPQGWIAVVMLVVFNGIVFAGVQFAIAVMRLGHNDGPGGGRRSTVPVEPLAIPVTVKTRR